MLVGLGEAPGTVAVRRAAGVAARAISNAASVALALPADTPELVRAVTEGYDLGGYTFTTYKTGRQGHAARRRHRLAAQRRSPGSRRRSPRSTRRCIVAEAVAGTRDWVNTAGRRPARPPAFADAVVGREQEARPRRPRSTIKVYDEKQLAELGCGGILGVGGGSAAPPRLVELTYAPDGAVAHLALVGKGITYDSGGLTIKPAPGMTTMKCDMAGAAAVVQATFAIARLGLPVKVTTFAPMAENMVSGIGDAPRRRAHPVRRHHRRGRSTPTPRAG